MHIVNLTEMRCHTVEDIMNALSQGMLLRAQGTTGANSESSRSHAIMSMSLMHYDKLYSKMSFIDLAGSERGADTMHTDKQKKMVPRMPLKSADGRLNGVMSGNNF